MKQFLMLLLAAAVATFYLLLHLFAIATFSHFQLIYQLEDTLHIPIVSSDWWLSLLVLYYVVVVLIYMTHRPGLQHFLLLSFVIGVVVTFICLSLDSIRRPLFAYFIEYVQHGYLAKGRGYALQFNEFMLQLTAFSFILSYFLAGGLRYWFRRRF